MKNRWHRILQDGGANWGSRTLGDLLKTSFSFTSVCGALVRWSNRSLAALGAYWPHKEKIPNKPSKQAAIGHASNNKSFPADETLWFTSSIRGQDKNTDNSVIVLPLPDTGENKLMQNVPVPTFPGSKAALCSLFMENWRIILQVNLQLIKVVAAAFFLYCLGAEYWYSPNPRHLVAWRLGGQYSYAIQGKLIYCRIINSIRSYILVRDRACLTWHFVLEISP